MFEVFLQILEAVKKLTTELKEYNVTKGETSLFTHLRRM
jgi:hypothetical protein